ncbi:MAG: Gfo/Idh/MocA family oxidoreductase [Bdellovibrionaceae bacterium]|nr:Gfo/Idh/MocA family oxidoreductase [Bdellovibrionales bacterium]MCB9253463.1 Gfo/Idh/MocA family oxidoreductase [Pseudobdellovibrionaceae bacterium]
MLDPNKIPLGIIGLGKMGGFHLQKAVVHPEVDVVGVYDPHVRAADLGARFPGIRLYSDVASLLLDTDAVVVASPTPTHFDLASRALRAGVDVLVEKPIAETVEQAERLRDLARSYSCLLQVGYLERYRLARLVDPTFSPTNVIAERLNANPGRESSIDVIADLMIHDLDLVLSLMQRMPVELHSWGERVKTDSTDEAEAHLLFDSGERARIRASRVSADPKRVVVLESGGTRHLLDLERNTRTVTTENGPAAEVFSAGSLDPLALQLDAFVHNVKTRTPPLVGVTAGIQTLRLVQQIQRRLMPFTDGPAGDRAIQKELQ